VLFGFLAFPAQKQPKAGMNKLISSSMIQMDSLENRKTGVCKTVKKTWETMRSDP
jgi:hypothetical protein